MACSVQVTSGRFGLSEFPTDDITCEDMKKQMSEQEWDKVINFRRHYNFSVFFFNEIQLHQVYEMSKDRNLYQNLITSLFPSIHGNNEVKRGILLMLFGGVAKNTIEGLI